MVFTALFLGLVSSLHCIGMCGPIAAMLPVDRNDPAKKATQIIIYHIGRISAYIIIGLLFGILGRGFYLAGIQQELSIAAGILMIVVVLAPERQFGKYNFSKPIYRLLSNVKTALGNQFKDKSYSSLYTIGFLNGFLPCGLVYAALFGAIAMQSISMGIAFMLLFGLGTVPMMSSVVYVNSFLTIPLWNKIQKIIPLVTIFIGILFILRGLGLGIPYISPSNLTLFVQQQPNCH